MRARARVSVDLQQIRRAWSAKHTTRSDLMGHLLAFRPSSFFGATPGATPLNYLQIYAADFLYAATHVDAPAQVVETGGASVSITAQDLLNLARQKLLEISERGGPE
jgi:hypothetical protein